MYGWRAKLACFAEELLHLACGLVHINNFARATAHAAPHMGNLARQEDALTGPYPKRLLLQVSQVFRAAGTANQKLKLAVDDIDPLILVCVEVTRAAASAG